MYILRKKEREWGKEEGMDTEKLREKEERGKSRKKNEKETNEQTIP